MSVRVGISGLRGTVEAREGLTAQVVLDWVSAFSVYMTQSATDGSRPVVVMGRDGRRSSGGIASLVRGTLQAAGIDVLDLGLTVTPYLQFTTRHIDSATGGVMVTASHNPMVWNGLKLVDRNGLFIDEGRWAELKRIRNAGEHVWVPLDMVGSVTADQEEARAAYLAALFDAVDVEAIRRRGFTVVLDACNSGAVAWREVLELLGCRVNLLHGEVSGRFEREPEPLPQHLGVLSSEVMHTGSDLGLAADPDGDRLALVDEDGRPLNEQYTFVLAAQAIAQPGDVVVSNVVTTHALESALRGVRVSRCAVGEMNVVRTLLDTSAVIGGEGSGGVILPRVNLARDGLVASVLVLDYLAIERVGLRELAERIPHWQQVRARFDLDPLVIESVRSLLASWRGRTLTVTAQPTEVVVGEPAASRLWVREDAGTLLLLREEADASAVEIAVTEWPTGLRRVLSVLSSDSGPLTVELIDGVKVSGRLGWLSLRASNTENILRLMGEYSVA